MTEINILDRFPRMRPIRSAPSLSRTNGCGIGVYGRRSIDAETGTYVTTTCICFLWIPILALRAYRVAKADGGGWYFLGREPLSTFARRWNAAVLGGALGLGTLFGSNAYTASPEYRAAKQMAEAKHLTAAGQPADAARLYHTVITGKSSRAGDAEVALKAMLDDLVQQKKLEDAAAVLDVVIKLQEAWRGKYIIRDPLAWGMPLVDQFADSDPRGASALLEVISPLAKDPAAVEYKREQLLMRAVDIEPENISLASKLALLYEANGDLEKCDALLTPRRNRLGTSEGARILGQSYAHRGELEASFALLSPYVEGRLQRLHAAEEEYSGTAKRALERALKQLKEGKGSNDFYRQFESADAAKKEAMVREYVEKLARDDLAILAAQEGLISAAKVVPVALDLGIVRLRRAQTMSDPRDRRGELQEAEKTFLAIRGLAGQSDEYRLFLGQVYYWLGKHTEGRALFDELLVAKQRGNDTLLSVAMTLREVGVDSEARKLVEEAYEKETDPTKKYTAARLRALIQIDLDDEIAWLKRANPSDIEVKASLNVALGNKAIIEGKDDQAKEHLRSAIAAYGSQTQGASALNNAALACFSLFKVTGEREVLDNGTKMLEKAVALDPSNSILLFNFASSTIDGAIMDIIGDAVNSRVLRLRVDLSLLPYLYSDAAGQETFQQRFATHPGVAQALTYFDKVMLLAPKKNDAYSAVASIHGYTRNLERLENLRRLIQQSQPDPVDNERKVLDFYAGKDDTARRADIEAGAAPFMMLVEAARSGWSAVTLAVSAGNWVRQQTAASMMGLPADPNAVVSLAESVHATAPSLGTHRTLLHALLFRASQNLAQQEPLYAEMVSRAGRSLPPYFLIAVALNRSGELRDAVLRNEDVRRVISLIREHGQAFPNSRSPWEWAMLRLAYPDDAGDVARAILQDQAGRVERAIERALASTNAVDAFNAYWEALLSGNEAEGLEILRAYAARGVPMPFGVK